MDKRAEFNNALKEAMKAKDEVGTGTIRLILSTLKDKEIAVRGTGQDVGDPEIMSMLQSMVKQRNESLKIYQDNARPELAAREAAEIRIIEGFLPKQMSDADVSAAIDAVIKETGAATIKDMGKVMGGLKAQYAGQMDMAKAGAVIKAKLS
ncbi:MAG: GatB/YqeY domain-containing protein [Alphaproteobacteria bacterium]